jgi:hypothetical protein
MLKNDTVEILKNLVGHWLPVTRPSKPLSGNTGWGGES